MSDTAARTVPDGVVGDAGSRRSWGRVAITTAIATCAFVAGVGVGLLVDVVYSVLRYPIQPVQVSQYYGVAEGFNSEGEFCITHHEDGTRCGEPRLMEGAGIPADGSPVRGGYAELPSDSSSGPHPSWLWLTTVTCGSVGSEGATRCP